MHPQGEPAVKRILISAGPTREPLDPVRFLSNRSTGKMGYALARAAMKAGFETVLVSGPVALPPPEGLARFRAVTTAAEMSAAMKEEFPAAEITVMCAAVADFRPVSCSEHKIKKNGLGMTLELEPTEDILLALGRLKRPGQILAGFAAETDSLEHSALGKLKKKNLDWIAANRADAPGEGFASDTNAVVMFGADGRRVALPLAAKSEIAERILAIITERNA